MSLNALLVVAATNGHDKCVRTLLDAGADKDGEEGDGKPLHFASVYGHHKCVYLLLQEGADVNIRGEDENFPINVAAEGGYNECVRLLLEAGANKDARARGYQNNTPLHLAAENGRIECIRLLLEARAERDLVNNDGETPLHLAAKNGRIECIRLLLGVGTDVTIRNKRGYTPLDMARLHATHYMGNKDTSQKCVRLIEEYIETNVLRRQPEQPEPEGEPIGPPSPDLVIKLTESLRQAAREGQVDIIRMLLEAGANKSWSDREGRTAAFYAAENGHNECLQLLL
jgi:ankyrin repeat protein